MNTVEQIKRTKLSFLYFLVALVLNLSALMAFHPAPSSAIGNGWADPLRPMAFLAVGFLANNCGFPGYGDYIPGRYHIANDYGAAGGANVFAIGAGTVIEVQTDWPGAAVFIRHTAADGTSFLAVYGHMSGAITGGAVQAGQLVGQVLDQGSNSHLHFGIRVAAAPAPTNNGAMPCSRWPDSNGYVDPVPFLTAHGATPPPPPPPPAPPPPPPPQPRRTSLPTGLECREIANERNKGIAERLMTTSRCR